jgi:hypothetical protein
MVRSPGIRTRPKASSNGLFVRNLRGLNRWATAQDRLESGLDCGARREVECGLSSLSPDTEPEPHLPVPGRKAEPASNAAHAVFALH